MTLVLRRDAGAVRHLTMNAPDRLNALSDAMLAALDAECADLEQSPGIRVVTLGGAGRAFCAGHDLAEMQAARQSEDGGRAAFADLFARCSALMQRLQHLPQPVIARVHGVAAAAGCQLVATCDLAVAAEGTRFGVNGVNIGLFCSTPMVALSRNAPTKHVFEMLVTGEFADAARARELGLVNRVVPEDDVYTTAEDLADTIAAKLGAAVRIGKQAFYRQRELTLSQAYAYTGEVMVENMMDAGTAEGMSAFLEKRDPDWNQ